MKMLPVLAFVSSFVMGCLVPPSDDLPVTEVCEPGEKQLCEYLGDGQNHDGKRTCNDDGESWGDCVPLDLPSTGQGGGGGATDTGGSGGSMAVECTTDDDCAAFNGACLVSKCENNVCFAFERDDDGDGSSLCGGNAPGTFDCDDTNSNVKPGATEICGDLIDSNCDGKVDEGCFDFCQPFPNKDGAGKNWYSSCCEVNGTFKQPQSATPKPFEIVKAAGWDGIYYMGSNGKRYVFPLMRVLSSWFSETDAQGIPANDPSICGLVTEYPAATIAAVTLGGNVTPKPFTFVTGQEGDSSSWISAPGQQRRMMAPGVAEQLFPAGSIAERTWLMPEAFFVNYTIGSDVNAPADYDAMQAKSITLEQDLGIAPMP